MWAAILEPFLYRREDDREMINLTEKQLKQLQRIELEMMIEFDRICRKHNITYTIIGGTLIGAVRDGGFIPWDDDVDIAMTRLEYEKFCNIVDSELDHERFYYQDMDRTPGYRWGYGKLRRKNTLFLREYQEHMPYEQGIFLDVFPHDYVPNRPLHRTMHDFRCFFIRKLFWSEVGRLADKKLLKRKVYQCMSRIPLETVKKWYYNLVSSSNKRKTKYMRSLMFPTFGKDHGYNSEWFEPGEDMEFEGHMFQCMKGAKEYLAYSYGNYMELPPESERKVHPVSNIKLIDVEIG